MTLARPESLVGPVTGPECSGAAVERSATERPLGTRRSYSLRAVAEPARNARWRRLDAAQFMLADPIWRTAVRGCGRHVRPSDDGGPGWATVTPCGVENVFRCQSVWGCPVCAPRIQARRGALVQRVGERCGAAGGSGVMVTLTVRHQRGDDLRELREALLGAWGDLWTGGLLDAYADRFGMVGGVRAVETTLGKNGFHPHIHAILFLDRPCPAWEADARNKAIHDDIMPRWLERVRERQPASEPDPRFAVKVTEIVDWEQGTYPFKGDQLERPMSAAIEATNGAEKHAHIETPFDLLDKCTARNTRLFRHYVSSMRGCKQLGWLRKGELRARGWMTDTEAESGEPDPKLGPEEEKLPERRIQVSAVRWRQLCNVKAARACIIASLAPDCPDRSLPELWELWARTDLDAEEARHWAQAIVRKWKKRLDELRNLFYRPGGELVSE